MKKLFILVLLLIPCLLFADIDTKDGVSITEDTDMDGFTGTIGDLCGGGDAAAGGGGETVSFRSYASACNGNPSGDYVTVNVPAGVQTGDIMIGYAGGDNDENMVALAGWTQIHLRRYHDQWDILSNRRWCRRCKL